MFSEARLMSLSTTALLLVCYYQLLSLTIFSRSRSTVAKDNWPMLEVFISIGIIGLIGN